VQGRYAPGVHVIKLTEKREIAPYKWAHPDEERWGRRNQYLLSASFDLTKESVMGLAEYMIVAQRNEWGVWHDGSINNRYATKESAFEAAVGAASLAIREGHEVRLSVPDRSAGNQTALGGRGADVGRLPCAS
jgi:hypothetical protein